MTDIPSYRAEKLAILGDLHGRWNAQDNAYFDQAAYDLLLFVGDLGSGTRKDGLAIIRQISRLQSRGLVLPGNNDAEHLPHLSAELAYQSGRADLLRAMHRNAAPGIEPCGYSCHQLLTAEGSVSLIAARPCATGGSVLSFPEMLARTYGVHDREGSIARLRTLVDRAPDSSLVFLAHNGPAGLGGGAEGPWSRDFPLPEGEEGPDDWGDDDLSDAIAYARARGKRVLAVIAGHMHRRSTRSARPFVLERDGTVYINAAVVPRIRVSEEGELHHFLELRLSPDKVEVQEHWHPFGS
ncbi:MAG TPA: metallophosphoesterase [Polyangiaceae bacterium]|nr:metallophosphoesterase [Polyangiaceae bacterium]